MIYVSGVGKIVEGPYSYESDEGDVIIQFASQQNVQCLARNYITARSLMDLKIGHSVHIEGILYEDQPGYLNIKLSSIKRLSGKGLKDAKSKKGYQK